MTSIKDKDLDDVLNGLFGRQTPAKPQQNNNGWKEIDLDNMFGGMVPRGVIQQPLKGPGIDYNPQQVTQIQQPTQSTVFVKEGSKSYRKLEIDSPMPVALEVGPTHNVVGKEFEYCGKIKVYITENINKTIDLSRMDNNRIVSLVVLKAPWIGTILVQEQSVIRKNDQTRQILKG
jgi:hypothetical protein